jgi:putative SOS response-associated peptidase YedK
MANDPNKREIHSALYADTRDSPIESCALVTTSAGPDVAPYQDRQPVILEQDDDSRVARERLGAVVIG